MSLQSLPRGIPSNRSAVYELGAFPQGDIVHVVVVAIHWSVRDEIGLAFATAIGMISSLSVLSLLTYLGRHLLKSRHPQASERSHAVRRFIFTDMGVYFTCLLLADLLYSLGYLANLKFLKDYTSRIGGLCTFQGMMFSIGYAGTGWFNSVVSVVTFMILVLRWKIPKWLMPVLVSFGWLFVSLITFLGPAIFAAAKHPFPFYGPNGIGCFVLAGAPTYQTWYILIPAFNIASLGIMIVCYLGIFLTLAGLLQLNRNGDLTLGQSSSPRTWSPWSAKSLNQPSREDIRFGGAMFRQSRSEVTDAAQRMLWYPVAYSVACIPLAIASFFDATTLHVPKQSLLSLCSCLGASISTSHPPRSRRVEFVSSSSSSPCFFSRAGIIDVLLFIFTRRALMRDHRENPQIDTLPSLHAETSAPLPSGSSKFELGQLSTPHASFGGGRKGIGLDGSSSTSLPLDEGSLTSRSDLVGTRSYDHGRKGTS